MRRKQVLSQCVFCLFLAWCAQVPCRGVMLHVLAWLLHPLMPEQKKLVLLLSVELDRKDGSLLLLVELQDQELLVHFLSVRRAFNSNYWPNRIITTIFTASPLQHTQTRAVLCALLLA